MLGETGRPGTWQERVDPAWWIWKAHGGGGVGPKHDQGLSHGGNGGCAPNTGKLDQASTCQRDH